MKKDNIDYLLLPSLGTNRTQWSGNHQTSRRRREGKGSSNQYEIHLQDQSLMGQKQPISCDCCGGCHQRGVSSRGTKLPLGTSPHTDTDTRRWWLDGWMYAQGGEERRQMKWEWQGCVCEWFNIHSVYTHQLLIACLEVTMGCWGCSWSFSAGLVVEPKVDEMSNH